MQVRMNNVTTRGTFDWSTGVRVPAGGAAVRTFQLHPGDVLFNNTNSTELVGKSALFSGLDEPVVYSNHFTRLRTSTSLSPAFLALWLQHQWRERVFEAICNRWIGQSAVQRDKLLALHLALPPLAEQRRIAAILTEQMDAVERARIAAEAQLNAARALPAAYLHAVFGSEEARRWPKTRLGHVLQLRKDVVHPRDMPVGQVTFVGLEHVEGGTGRRRGSILINMAHLTGRKPRFYAGDIVYGYLRPYLNKVWVADFDGLCSVDQYVYSVVSSLADPTFIAWFMRSPTYLAGAPIDTTPGQLPRIRTEEVAGVEVHLPPLDVQKSILARLSELMGCVEVSCTALVAQVAAINALPAALLRRAFAGEL